MKNARKSPWRLLYKFHRYSGLVAAVILMMLAITGIALNHTEDLQLSKRYIASTAILDWYGIKTPEHIISFKTNKHWLTQVHDQIYYDHELILKKPAELIGAVETDSFVVMAFIDSLVLTTLDGEIIEQVQKNIQQLGKNNQGHIVIRNNNNTLFSDDDLLSWKRTKQTASDWSQPSRNNNPYQQQLLHQYRSNIIPYERVMLDIHSGRFFGRYGVLLIDITGIILFLLAVSGCWMWLRHKFKHYRAKHHTKAK